MKNQFTSTLVLALGLALAGPVVTAFANPVPASPDAVQPLLIGSHLPPISLRAVDGTPVDLNASVAQKPTVLVFYRGGWCPFCNMQLGSLHDVQPQLDQLGYQLIAISPDRPEELAKSIAKHDLHYTLLSDSKMTACQAMGIAYQLDDATLAKYKAYGVDLDKASGESTHMLPVPSVFVLGTDGVIKFSYSNPNYKVRLAPDVLLAEAKAALGP